IHRGAKEIRDFNINQDRILLLDNLDGQNVSVQFTTQTFSGSLISILHLYSADGSVDLKLRGVIGRYGDYYLIGGSNIDSDRPFIEFADGNVWTLEDVFQRQ